jgi:hypothetical protein
LTQLFRRTLPPFSEHLFEKCAANQPICSATDVTGRIRNGVEVASEPYDGLTTPTVEPLGIGAKLAGGYGEKVRGPSGFWDGRIDEVAVFNYGLDKKTIQQLYETEN